MARVGVHMHVCVCRTQRVMAAATLQRELLTEEEEREKEGVGEVQGAREPLMIKR